MSGPASQPATVQLTKGGTSPAQDVPTPTPADGAANAVPPRSRGRVLMVVAVVLGVVVAGAVVWQLFFALPPEPQGLAPIPTTFPDVVDGLNARLTVQGEPVEVSNPDADTGPGHVAVYRFAQLTDEAEAMMQRVTGEDERIPGAEIGVAIGSARRYAEALEQGEKVDSPFGSEMTCRKLPGDTDLAAHYACRLEYGNGWVISTYGDVGLTGEGQYEDLRVIAGVAQVVKDNNAFERAVQNHATM